MSESATKIPWQRLTRFVIIGGGAFVIDFGLYYIFTRFGHFPYLASRTVSITLSMIWNFFLNRSWTFQATNGPITRQATRFIIVMVATSLLNLALMHVGVSTLHLNDLLTLVAVTGLITLVNFVFHQAWSYAE